MAGISVHDDRNRCSASVGIGVHLRPEWVFTMVRNTQARKEPPPGTQVWLGKYGGEEWKLRWKRCAFGLYAAVGQSTDFSKAPPNAFTVTFVVGSVVLLVFFRATELMPPFEFRVVPESLLQIWPLPKSPRFAPSNGFNDADMAVLSEAIFAQAGELADREIDADSPLRPRTPSKKS